MKNKENEIINTLLYEGSEGAVTGQFLIDGRNETLWASQKTVAEIFGTTGQNISKHFTNIFADEELIENEVSISSKDLFKGQEEFINYSLKNSKKGGRPEKWYNLDGIISVRYRVNSKNATHFRKWATNILKEYIVKGYVLDKELLKNGTKFGKDYFDKLLEEIKEIRSSERRFYQKVTDIYATSYDYNPKAKVSQDFFKKVQNKLHYAVSKKTAPEIISERANSSKSNMGLTSWDNAPDGKILLKDVLIAKNYLNKEEITELDEIVTMYLDYAANQARRQKPMSMNDWAERLDKFLQFNEYDIWGCEKFN
ncbi:MAG: virulence RhuM family protein [Methanobrevibacter sp.]|jgi:hypothetical protein|nr:virulence RhuM family protein [Methanobrevibacter sp.]